MRKLVLTGLGTEQPFFPKSGNPGAAAKYFLIFNDGEFRVEVTESGAELCVAKMMEGSENNGTPLREVEYDNSETAAQPKPPEGIVMAQVGNTYSDTDDGVDQV